MMKWIPLFAAPTLLPFTLTTSAQDPYPCVPTGTLLDTTVVCTDQECTGGVEGCIAYVQFCANTFVNTGFHVDYAFFCASKTKNGLL